CATSLKRPVPWWSNSLDVW
nr:immunoglobulin heavy chain junction region [Macaca mulatta]MOW19108.1 immunoglobulin heavy chain junction region [Macaca mulatta]MOW20302.1 immunoglobulin heavy chain junction region [Macaca mulatta]MOW21436.1 immunoglobulin heavy chain junction region [Macaca mulatta]MOW21749.1 immunoglobulin heavy chain junction region [Macaca mulatta]